MSESESADRWRTRKKTRVTGVSFHHRRVWGAAQRLLQQADEDPGRRWHEYLAAVLLSSFAFEGLLNYIGDELYPSVWTEERSFFGVGQYRGTDGKLKYLAEKLNLAIDRSRRPFQSFRELLALRNETAHLRHEVVDEEIVTSMHEIGQSSDIPELARHEAAHRVIQDLTELSEGLYRAALKAGLPGNPEETAFTGVVSSRAYDNIP